MSSPAAGSGARALGQLKRAATLRGAIYNPFDGALPQSWLTPMNATETNVTVKLPKLPPPMPSELYFERRQGFGCSLLIELHAGRLYATLYYRTAKKRQTLNCTDCTLDVCFIQRTSRAGTVLKHALNMLGSRTVISVREAKQLKSAYGLEIKDLRL